MCSEAGVKLACLPSYSPDLNPIEELFLELKALIRHTSVSRSLFGSRIRYVLGVVCEHSWLRVESAEGHFRHAGLAVKILTDSAVFISAYALFSKKKMFIL
jgi:hypothetical protein